MNCPSDNIRVLQQGVELLHAMPRDLFDGRAVSFDGYGVGAHFRHLYDHYRLLLQGMAHGRINYDARERNPEFEADPELAASLICSLYGPLEQISKKDAEKRVMIRMCTAASDPAESWMPSSVERELLYLLMHDIHHYAIIRSMLASTDLILPAYFGFAPSTVEYLERQEPCAQ